MLKPGGFNELGPQQQIIYDKVIQIIRKNYQSFGYTNISTPAVEKTDVLLAKSGQEASKQIFGLYGLAQGTEDIKDYSLRFDLTIPFARYILDWKKDISFPFKRSQIQNVWRGERQQKCRFKEFSQADIDVIWEENEGKSFLYYDTEVLFVVYKAISEVLDFLEKRGFKDDFFLRINHRKIVFGFLNALFGEDEAKKEEVSGLIDKYEKIGEENFVESLKEIEVQDEQIEKILKFLKAEIDLDTLPEWKGFVDNEEFNTGIEELYQIVSELKQISESWGIELNYKIDFLIIRGLDYYTGMVFETNLKQNSDIGSICSGGRYDKLTYYLDEKTNFSGVGGSIGIDRFLCLLFEDEFLKLEENIGVSDFLFLNFRETKTHTFRLMKEYFDKGWIVEMYPEEEKLKKQFRYTDKKKIKKVVILGKEEYEKGVYKIRDMETGKEEEWDLPES